MTLEVSLPTGAVVASAKCISFGWFWEDLAPTVARGFSTELYCGHFIRDPMSDLPQGTEQNTVARATGRVKSFSFQTVTGALNCWLVKLSSIIPIVIVSTSNTGEAEVVLELNSTFHFTTN